MVYFLTITELLSVIALFVFESVLNDQKGKSSPFKIISMLIVFPFVLYLAAEFLTVLPILGVTWSYQSMVLIAAHTAFNFMMTMLLLVALVKFDSIPFNYDKQYLVARGALYFSFVFEILALCAFVVCCVMFF